MSSGFGDVAVLEGGLDAWRQAGLAVETVERELAGGSRAPGELAPREPAAVALPSLAERFALEGTLPARRRLTTLFVDIAGSTRLITHHPPETVLALVQRFLGLVTDVALAYCGDVKDYEGDGALLYFESTPEATRAALAIQAALARGQCDTGAATTPRVAARLSLTVGDVVIGIVGSSIRQAIALVGPSVTMGSRLLRRIEPGGIVASGEVVEILGAEASELAARFQPLDATFEVPGMEGLAISTWVVPVAAAARAAA